MSTESFAHHFSLANIPFGIASSTTHPTPAAVTRIGDDVYFLDKLFELGIFKDVPNISLHTFTQPTLNEFAALGREVSKAVRAAIQAHVSDTNGTSHTSNGISHDSEACSSQADAKMYMPVHVGDFTDFSCSAEHVVNAGEAVFGERKMPPGFPHFPLGYGGRSSSIVVSGNPVKRPLGQYRSKTEKGKVVFGPCQDLDYELELGCIIGKSAKMGEIVTAAQADDHIFGVVLLNDWSARDILGLEIVPLGPLNGKGFMTSISPWVVTLDALEPFATPSPARDAEPASYLKDPNPNGTYSVELQAEILVDGTSTTVCTTKLDGNYWSFRSIVAHQAIGGCGLQSGDLVATGTVSGKTSDSLGCLLEMTMDGKRPFNLTSGSARSYLEDGDEMRISGFAGLGDAGVGFGECVGKVSPALVFALNGDIH